MRIVNLLPKSEQEELQKEKIYFAIRMFVFLSFSSYLLFLLALLGVKYYDKYNLSSLGSQIQNETAVSKKYDNAAIKAQIDKYNASISDYNNLAAQNPRWSQVLAGFSQLVPSDVLVTNFNANTKSGKIDITGMAKTRESVLQLRSNIAGSKIFKDINLPLENLQQPTNLSFHYTFYLQEGALK